MNGNMSGELSLFKFKANLNQNNEKSKPSETNNSAPKSLENWPENQINVKKQQFDLNKDASISNLNQYKIKEIKNQPNIELAISQNLKIPVGNGKEIPKLVLKKE